MTRLADDRRVLFAASLALHAGIVAFLLMRVGSAGLPPGPPVATEVQMEAIGVGGGGAAVPSDERETVPQGAPDATAVTEMVTETVEATSEPVERVTAAEETTRAEPAEAEPVTAAAPEPPPVEARAEPAETRLAQTPPPPLETERQTAETPPEQVATAQPEPEPREAAPGNDLPQVLTTTGLSEPPVEAVTPPVQQPVRPPPQQQPRSQPQRAEPARRPPPQPTRAEQRRIEEARAERAERARREAAASEARRAEQAERAARAAAQRAEAAQRAPGADQPSGQTGAPGGRPAGGGNSANYQALVRAELQRRHYYPPDARARGEQGVATVRFVIGSNGRVGSHSIVRGSGSRSLDLAVAQILGRIALPAPPSGTFTVTVPMRWELR